MKKCIEQSGVYAILYREQIIYIGKTHRSFILRWGSHIFAACNCYEQNKYLTHLYMFINDHLDDIKFKPLITESQIEAMGYEYPASIIDIAEEMFISVYSPIFNRQFTENNLYNNSMYSVKQIDNLTNESQLKKYMTSYK